MQRLFLMAMLLTIAACGAGAQTIDEGFEQWKEALGSEAPVGWSGSAAGCGIDSAARSGRFAASVWNWYYYGKGFFVMGEGLDHPSIPYGLDRTGTAIDFKPARITGYYRYRAGDIAEGEQADSAVVLVLLKKYNHETGRPDTVGYATAFLKPVDDYTPFTIDIIDAAPGMMPDSIALALISSNSGFCDVQSAGTCYYFTVDDLRLASPSGVSLSVADLLGQARVVPNPVWTVARITWDGGTFHPRMLRIYDVRGNLMRNVEGITGGGVTFDRSGLAPGSYIFELREAAGNAAVCGRFVVQ